MTNAYYLGPEGTFTHAAALALCGSAAALLPCRDITAVFEAMNQDSSGLGVVPIENSLEGSVSFTLDGLMQSTELQLVAEHVLAIEQCLVSDGALSEIRNVRSHPHALAQCKQWLRANLPQAKLISTGSTALAVHEVQGVADAAAIAPRLASQLRGVPIVAAGIQDGQSNATRFVKVGRAAPPPTGRDKTSICLATPHERGALHRTLGIFDQEGLNLCRIESRPLRDEPWKYRFLVDLEGHATDPPVARALSWLDSQGQLLRLFGSYPKAEEQTASPIT